MLKPMVSALLEEIPCLIDEADELMARLCCHKALLTTHLEQSTISFPAELSKKQDLHLDESSKDRKQPCSQHPSSSNETDIQHILKSIDMKCFSRQYLTMQSMAFDKLKGMLPSGDVERSTLYSAASSLYHLMKRLHNWQQTAWESLGRFLADNSTNDLNLLTFDSHPQLTRLVLTTVTKYVKLNLLWTSFDIIPSLLALYDFLPYVQSIQGGAPTDKPHAVYSLLERTDHRMREFVLHFGTTPLLAIQQDFQLRVADKGASLAALALSCFDRYDACRDLLKLRHEGVFDIEPLVSGAFAAHACLPDLLNTADITDWILCVGFCVPHHFYTRNSRTASMSSPGSPQSLLLWDFVEMIARNRLVLTLYRNRVVNLHNLLYQQVMVSPLTTTISNLSSVPSLGASRPCNVLRKSIKALSKLALRSCGVNHRQRREVSRWLIQNCVQLMRHNPGLVAPSFPLFLAALSIARDEIKWATVHNLNASNNYASFLPKHIKAKHLHRVESTFCGAEEEIADLLTHCHHLQILLKQHSHFLCEYYQTFLLNGDADGIADTIRELFESNKASSECQSLLRGFLDRDRYRVHTMSSSWLGEWRLANAHLATQTQLPLLDKLRTQMECVVRHTEYICVSSQLIERAVSFTTCWWFRHHVFEYCFKQALITAPSSAVGLLAILSNLVVENDSLDEFVDSEEVTQQLKQMQQLIDRIRLNLLDQVELALLAVVRQDFNLQRDDISAVSDESSRPVESKITASGRRLSSFPRVQSSQVQRSGSAALEHASPTSPLFTCNRGKHSEQSNLVGDEERCVLLVHALLDHIEQHPEDSTMQTALICRVQRGFIRFIRNFVELSSINTWPTTIEGAALRCSIRDASVHTQCFLRATQRMFGCNKVVKTSLFEAIQKALRTSLADDCSASNLLFPQGKRLLEWTIDPPRIFEKDLKLWSLADRFSWFYVCLVTKKCHPSSSQAPAVAKPLILAAVRKRCFVLTPGMSTELDPQEYTNPSAIEHIAALIGLKGVESICSVIVTLVIAQTLKLRSSIEAEHAVLAFMDMAMSNDSNADVSLASAQIRALDDMAIQLIQIGTAAFLLQLLHDYRPHETSDAWDARVAPQLLEEIQQDPDRRATWTRLLPVVCSSGFHSSLWNRTSYVSNVEATDTNAHMMGIAIARLLSTHCNRRSVHRCAIAALKRITVCSRSTKSKRLDSGSSTRPLLQALKLLVITAASIQEETTNSGHDELEPSLDRLLPNAMLMLHTAL